MSTETILSFLYELTYLLVVLGVFLIIALIKGKQSLINIILALYLGLLISLQFPYYDLLVSGAGAKTESIVKILVFTVWTVLAVWLFNRLMPREFSEKAFSGFGMKVLFALSGTVLVMAFSYNALPITEFITPGSPIQTLFGPEALFFWWLLLPLGVLFLL